MNYTLELKETILEKYKKGKSVASLIREYEIPRSSIYNWLDLYLEKSIEDINVSKKQSNLLHSLLLY